MIFLPWLRQNLRPVLSSAAVSFLSASISGISLVLIQGVFGKEKSGSTTDIARSAIDFLGADRAVLVAIGIWGFSTYFLNNFNERLTSKRLEARKVKRQAEDDTLSAGDRRHLVNESHFFESIIGFINHIIRTLVFALTLLAISPNIIRLDVLVSVVYIFIISRQRFEKGRQVSSEDRQSKLELKGRKKDKDFSKDFDIYIKRSWLSARLDSGHLAIFILLILTPFILSDIFALNILDGMVLFTFSTLLIFFSNAIHLSIQSANIGFRFHAAFEDHEITDEEE